MLWRVVVLAELIDPVASSAHLSVALRASEPEIVPVDRASCRIAVTIEGSDGLDAGERALGLISDALGAGITSVPRVLALHPHGEDFNPYAIGSP